MEGTFLIHCGIAAGALGFVLVIPALMIWFERRAAAFVQDRLGPNRVGPFGLFQPFADVLKLFFKEDMRPAGTDFWLYNAAPVIAFVVPAVAFAVIPYGCQIEVGGQEYALQVGDLHVGVLFLLAVGGLSVYAMAFGGWASNNKYSLMGGLRASAQLISYELALGLALVSVLMTQGTVYPGEMVRHQSESLALGLPAWGLFTQPLAFVIFVVAAFAENNRLPFDMSECEPELVAGFHTEYSSMRFALFFVGEYIAMVVMSALAVTLFLGGWSFPGLVDPLGTSLGNALWSVAVFAVKLGLCLFVFVWVRWTLPRFRYDQLMAIGWKVLIPLALANVCLTGVIHAVS